MFNFDPRKRSQDRGFQNVAPDGAPEMDTINRSQDRVPTLGADSFGNVDRAMPRVQQQRPMLRPFSPEMTRYQRRLRPINGPRIA